MVVDEVGGGADDYCGVAGSRHEEAVRLADEGTVSQHLHPAFRLERGRNPFLLDTFHLYQQAVAGGGGAELQRAVGTERESEGAVTVGLDPVDHHLVGKGGERGLAVCHSSRGETAARYGFRYVEFAPVSFIAVDGAVMHVQAAHGQVAHTVGACHEIPVEDFRSLHLASVIYQLAHFVEPCQGAGTVVVIGAAAPESLFVELQDVVLHPSVDHGTHIGIAYREGFEPMLRRLVIPEQRRVALY